MFEPGPGNWIRISAQVGEWLKPADCKSAPPSEVRRFESFPVHQNLKDQVCGEAIRDSSGRVCSLSGFGANDVKRYANPGCNAGGFGVVCREDVGATQRCNPSGWRKWESAVSRCSSVGRALPW